MEGTKELTPEVLQAVANFEAYQQNSAIMYGIAREMKEIAELPSEKLVDSHPLIRVEFPAAGGVITYMEGYDHPYKGFPFFEFVDSIDFMKKTMRAMMSSFYHSLKEKKWKFLIAPFFIGELSNALIYTFYKRIERFRIKPIRHCDAIRELHRAFTDKSKDETVTMVRDIMCMILEFDNAYRFRFQDVFVELDKNKLKKNPGKELARLLELMMTREKTQEIKDTWTLVKYFLPMYLLVNRKLRQQVIDVLGDLDTQKVKLSIEDESFCLTRKDYQFGFTLT